MARQGYIKLYRKVIDDDVFVDPYKFKLWTLCLAKASHNEHDVLIGNQVVHVSPGQFVTGRDALEKEYNRGCKKTNFVTGITLFRWLSLFEKTEKLNIKKTNKYTVITVLNWHKYQNKH